MDFKMPLITNKSLLDVLKSRTDNNTAQIIANIADAMESPSEIMIIYNDLESTFSLGNLLIDTSLHDPKSFLEEGVEYKVIEFNPLKTTKYYHEHVLKVKHLDRIFKREYKVTMYSYSGLVKFCKAIGQDMTFFKKIKAIKKDYKNSLLNQEEFDNLI